MFFEFEPWGANPTDSQAAAATTAEQAPELREPAETELRDREVEDPRLEETRQSPE